MLSRSMRNLKDEDESLAWESRYFDRREGYGAKYEAEVQLYQLLLGVCQVLDRGMVGR